MWHLSSHKELHTLIGHTAEVTSVLIIPGSYRAVSASQDATIRIWDLISGVTLDILRGHQYGVNALSITPNGEILASVSWDKTLKIWNLKSGKLVSSFKEDGHLLACAISPDGSNIIAGEESGKLHFLKLEGFSPICDLWQQARQAKDRNDYKKAGYLYLKVLPESKYLFGLEKIDLIKYVREIAEFHLYKQNFSSAIRFFMLTLSIQKRVLGEKHFEVAKTLFSIGNIYEKWSESHKEDLCVKVSDLNEAECSYLEALSVLNSFPKDTPEIRSPYKVLALSLEPQVLCSLAQLYQTSGKYSLAEELYTKALSITRQTRGKESSEVADILEEIGLLSLAIAWEKSGLGPYR